MAKRGKATVKPKLAVKPKRDSLTRELLSAIDEMQDLAPGTVAEIHDAPQTARGTPWRMAVRFIFQAKNTTYEDVFEILREWRDDRTLERRLGKDRLARIQVRYADKKGRGAHGEYTLGEIGAWSSISSRAAERVGIRDGRQESLIARYGEGSKSTSYIESLIVWLSPFTAREIRVGRKADKKKVDKSRRRV